MASRATKSGFAAEAQAKIMGKYNPEEAAEVMGWIGDILPDSGITANGDWEYVHQKLMDGYELCRLVKAVGGGPGIKDKGRQNFPFKRMECIGQFLDAAKAYGVPDTDMFQTVDLYEHQNMHQVIVCLRRLASKARDKGYKGFGPKEATENKRDFTEEQLKAGQNVIGLQMGTNKGASQAGQSFGKQRMIID